MKVAELVQALKALKADAAIPIFVADEEGTESPATRLDVEGRTVAIQQVHDDELKDLTIGRLLANLDTVPQSFRVVVCGDDGTEGALGYVALEWYGLKTDGLSCVRLRRTPPTTGLDYWFHDLEPYRGPAS